MAVVGNTAMLQLLMGGDGGLLDPDAWGAASAWPSGHVRWHLGDGCTAEVDLVRPLGGFVGSDLLAAAVAANLIEGSAPALLLDFGTNTEIALWDGKSLSVTSAAGGPAFEASGLRCAVPADAGAIFRVRPGSPLGFDVIGGGEPTGVCGSGLVDWVAYLRQAGSLSARGNLQGEPSLGGDRRGIVLRKRDVDVFQRAKAAIGAGVQVLTQRAGIATGQLSRVVTTGLFGRALDVANAQAIGLLPWIAPERVETYDNLALAGCELLLTSEQAARAVDALRGRAQLVNLARCDAFEQAFLEGLFLAPLGAQ